jgi:hypothetical protein
MRVFELENGKRSIPVVAGLTWHPIVPGNFKRELRPLSQDLGADLYVYRKSNKSMVGFAKSEEGATAGQIPIALIISQCIEEESQPANALVAVEIPDSGSNAEPTYIYVLIRDGFVLADGDQVGNEDEIRTRFLSDLSVSGWDLLIAPDHWKVNLASSRELTSFLPKNGSKVKIPTSWQLRPVTVSLKRTIVMAVVIAALAAGGYTAFDVWKKAEAAKRQAQIAAQQAASEELARQKKLAREPWKDLPRASAFMATCDAAMRRVGVTAGNWSMSKFACENGTFTIWWQRSSESALVSHLKAIYPGAVFSEDSATAMVSIKAMNGTIGKNADVLPAYQTRIDSLRDSMQRYGIAVSINKNATPVQEPNLDGQPQQSPVTPWMSFEITAESKLSSQSTVEALDAPGFRITKVEGALKKGLINYQLKGTQYAKP